MERILRSENPGFSLECVTSGFDAFQQLARTPFDFDVLIVDYQIREMTGLELLQELKKTNNRIPSVLLADWFDPALKDGALQAGANAFITKTGNFRQLLNKIADTIRQLVDAS